MNPVAWVLVGANGKRDQAADVWFADQGLDPNSHPHGIRWRDEIAPIGGNAPFRWVPLYAATRDEAVEEFSKIVERKAQSLADEYCHTEHDTGAHVWSNKEAEWQALLLGELADEFRALVSKVSP